MSEHPIPEAASSADMKAMLADVGMTLEILSPAQHAEAMREIEWPSCPPRTDGAQPHCPDCSGAAIGGIL